MKIAPIRPNFNTRYYAYGSPKENQSAQFQGMPAINAFSGLKFHNRDIVQNSPVSFTGFDCSPGSFVIKRLNGIICPCCGKPIPTPKQISALEKNLGNSKGEELQNALAKGLKYYRPNEEEIACILIETSEAHPEMNLQELTALQAELNRADLEKTQKDLIARIKSLALKLSDEKLRERTDEITDCAIKEIDESTPEKGRFSKNAMAGKLRAAKAKCGSRDTKLMDKIIKVSEKMPNTYNNKGAFFIKYQRVSGTEIAHRLLSPTKGTTEHIRPRSTEGGDDNTANYMPLCSDCNFHRATMPYQDWLRIHPEMTENLQTFLNTVSDKISRKTFKEADDYTDYPDDLIKTIKRETDGLVILKKSGASNADDKIKPQKNLSKEEIRKNCEQEIGKLNLQLENLNNLYEVYRKDKEYVQYRFHAKESEKFFALRREKDKKLGTLSSFVQKKAQIKENITKAKKKSFKPQYMETLFAARDRADAQIKEARDVYREVSERYEKQKQKVDKIRSSLEFPHELQGRMSDIQRRIKTMKSLSVQIRKLKEETKGYDDIVRKITQLQEEMEACRERLHAIHPKPAEEDELSEEGQKIIDTLSAKDDELKVLQKDKKALDKKRTHLERRKTSLQKLKSEKSKSDLLLELDELRARKKEIECKLENIDLPEQIEKINEKISQVWTIYAQTYN